MKQSLFTGEDLLVIIPTNTLAFWKSAGTIQKGQRTFVLPKGEGIAFPFVNLAGMQINNGSIHPFQNHNKDGFPIIDINLDKLGIRYAVGQQPGALGLQIVNLPGGRKDFPINH